MTVDTSYLDMEPGTQLGNAIYVGNLDDGSEEWHHQRSKVVGGSEVASIIGIPAFQSKYMLWLEKAGHYKRPEPSLELEELFWWGHALEEPIARRFEQFAAEHEMLKDLELSAVLTGSWVSAQNSWHGANPDRLLLNGDGQVVGILEIKYSSSGAGWENDSCPHKYVVQLRWYLQAFGLRYGYLVCLSGGKLLVFRVSVARTEAVLNMRTGEQEYMDWGGPEMVPVVGEFVDSLPSEPGGMDGTPPTPTLDDDSKLAFAQKHPDIENRVVEVPYELARRVYEARVAMEKASLLEEGVKGELMEAMGSAKTAKYGTKNLAGRQARGGGAPFLKYSGKPHEPVPPEVELTPEVPAAKIEEPSDS